MRKTIAELESEHAAAIKAYLTAKGECEARLAPLLDAYSRADLELKKARLRAELEAELACKDSPCP